MGRRWENGQEEGAGQKIGEDKRERGVIGGGKKRREGEGRGGKIMGGEEKTGEGIKENDMRRETDVSSPSDHFLS